MLNKSVTQRRLQLRLVTRPWPEDDRELIKQAFPPSVLRILASLLNVPCFTHGCKQKNFLNSGLLPALLQRRSVANGLRDNLDLDKRAAHARWPGIARVRLTPWGKYSAYATIAADELSQQKVASWAATIWHSMGCRQLMNTREPHGVLLVFTYQGKTEQTY